MKISDLKFITDIPDVRKEVTNIHAIRGERYKEDELPIHLEKFRIHRYYYTSYEKHINRNPIFKYTWVEIKVREVHYAYKETNYFWCVYLTAPLSVFTKIWGYTTPEAVFESEEIFDDLGLVNSKQTYGGYAENAIRTEDPMLRVGIDFAHYDQLKIEKSRHAMHNDLVPRVVAEDALQLYQGIISDYLYATGCEEA